ARRDRFRLRRRRARARHGAAHLSFARRVGAGRLDGDRLQSGGSGQCHGPRRARECARRRLCRQPRCRGFLVCAACPGCGAARAHAGEAQTRNACASGAPLIRDRHTAGVCNGARKSYLSDLRAFECRSRVNPRSVSAAHHFTPALPPLSRVSAGVHAALRPGHTQTDEQRRAMTLETAPAAVYFDGTSSRKRSVALRLGADLELVENGAVVNTWPYDQIRRVDGPPALVRLRCATALPLARLEIADAATAETLLPRCPALDLGRGGAAQTWRVVGWSIAAVASIVAVTLLGIPPIAGRPAPLVSFPVEERSGGGGGKQIRTPRRGHACASAARPSPLPPPAGH